MLTLALSWHLLLNSLASEKAVTIHHNWASSLKLFLSSIQKPPSLPLLSSHHLSNNLRQHSLLSLGMHTGNEQPHSIIPVQLSMLICFRQKCRLFTIIYMVICIAQIKILWGESPPPPTFSIMYTQHTATTIQRNGSEQIHRLRMNLQRHQHWCQLIWTLKQ